jgi:predicted metalloendopeptidase
LAGDPTDKAQKAAQRLLVFETKLAKVSRKLVDLRDPQANYHKMERRTLDKMAPGFGWPLYFRTLGLPDGEKRLVVGQPEFLQGFARLTGTAPLEDVKTYLRWHLLNATAEYLGKDLESADFDFYGKTLRGRKEMFPRWKRVLFAVDRGIGEDLGQAFVKRAFSPEAKAKVLEMVRFHREALKLTLQRAPWMSDATKTQALHKLETMNAKVGYPDQWRDYSEAGIKRQPYVLNALAANAFEFRRRLAKLGKPVDRTEWEMTPQTNNAYYTPVLNEIVLPAGILQPPFFSETADDASNYGALASTIGHELLHGFDDEGSQYNADGNLKNWWTVADRKAYDALTAKVAAQYDAFEVQPGLHIDGRQTLGENLADIGGLKISFEAWKLATAGKPQSPKDGLSPEQRFFVAFAQGWRTNTRPEALRLQVQSDVHSPVRWRVNGPAAALPEVGQAFGCPSHADATPIW